jgi:hypothetical protein
MGQRTGSFRIRSEIPEKLIYWEGDDGFQFDCGWGVNPYVVYLPDGHLWDEVVPAWLVGRRAEVAERLRRHSGYTVADTDAGYRPSDAWRIRSPATEAARRLHRRQVLTNPRIMGPLVMVALLFLGAIALSLALASVAPGAVVGGIVGAVVATLYANRRRKARRIARPPSRSESS